MGISCRRRPALSVSMLLTTFVLTLAADGKSPGVFRSCATVFALTDLREFTYGVLLLLAKIFR